MRPILIWMASLLVLGQLALVAGLEEDVSSGIFPTSEMAKLDLETVSSPGRGDYTYDDVAVVKYERKLAGSLEELGAGVQDECADNPAWATDCVELAQDHCKTSQVMLIKCRKTCGCGPAVEDIIPHVDILTGLTPPPANTSAIRVNATAVEEMGELAVMNNNMLDAAPRGDMSLSLIELDEQVKMLQDQVQHAAYYKRVSTDDLGEAASMTDETTAQTKFVEDRVCSDYPEWSEDCEILSDQCVSSYVMKIKCRKTCGCGPYIPDPMGPPPPPASPSTSAKPSLNTTAAQPVVVNGTLVAEKEYALATQKLQQEENKRKANDAADKEEEQQVIGKESAETENFNSNLEKMQKQITGSTAVESKVPATDANDTADNYKKMADALLAETDEIGEGDNSEWSESLGDSLDGYNVAGFVQLLQERESIRSNVNDITRLHPVEATRESATKQSMRVAMKNAEKVTKAATKNELEQEAADSTAEKLTDRKSVV